MVIFFLLLSGLFIAGLLLIVQLAVVLLATLPVAVSAMLHDDLIQTLVSEARKEIDQATHAYLDQIYFNQFKKENQNED